MVEQNKRTKGSGETPKEYGTQVVYALVLEHLKRATSLCIQNADAERAINKKANVNYRLTKQIEHNKEEQKNKDSDIIAQDSKSKELSVEQSRLKDAASYLDLTLFVENDQDKCNEIADSQEEGATEQFIDMIQSLANRCNNTNKELERELRQKQKESLHKQRLNFFLKGD